MPHQRRIINDNERTNNNELKGGTYILRNLPHRKNFIAMSEASFAMLIKQFFRASDRINHLHNYPQTIPLAINPQILNYQLKIDVINEMQRNNEQAEVK